MNDPGIKMDWTCSSGIREEIKKEIISCNKRKLKRFEIEMRAFKLYCALEPLINNEIGYQRKDAVERSKGA